MTLYRYVFHHRPAALAFCQLTEISKVPDISDMLRFRDGAGDLERSEGYEPGKTGDDVSERICARFGHLLDFELLSVRPAEGTI